MESYDDTAERLTVRQVSAAELQVSDESRYALQGG